MSKVTLSQVADITQATTAQTTINNNSTTVQTAFDNTLSRDGTQPNTMLNNLDMNSNHILNLPAPSSTNEPARLIDVVSNPTIVVPGTGTSGHVVPFLDGNSTFSGSNTFTGTQAFGTVAASGTVSSPTVILNGATSGTTTITPQAIASGTVTLPNGPATLLSTGGAFRSGVSASNPAGTTSLTEVMMGLGSTFTFTPTYSSRAFVSIMGEVANSVASDGSLGHIRFGTGTAPVNGAAATGSTTSGIYALQNNANTANMFVPATLTCIVSALVPGTTYWFDISIASLTGGTSQFINAFFTVFEM